MVDLSGQTDLIAPATLNREGGQEGVRTLHWLADCVVVKEKEEGQHGMEDADDIYRDRQESAADSGTSF